MANISYSFTPDNNVGQTEVILTYSESKGSWIFIIKPQRDEWLNGDIADLIECLQAASKLQKSFPKEPKRGVK